MTFFKYKNIRITGVASAVPTKKVNTIDFVNTFGEEAVKKFIDMTGVVEHRETIEHQTASDLGFAAAERLLNEKGIDRDSIGVLIFGSHSTDYRRPATACVLHKRLKLKINCISFDVGLGCSAFVYCTQIAASMLKCSEAKRALVIVGESLSKMTYPNDKSTVMLFGDGGAATLLEKTDEDNTLSGELCTDGSGYRSIIIPAGGFRNLEDTREPMNWGDGSFRTLYNVNMNGTDVFSFTVTKVPKTIKAFLAKTNQTVTDFDCLAFHQANRFIHQQLAKKLKADMSKMPLNLDRYGNTSAPAIPLLLSDVYGNDVCEKEINVLMCGFGVGLSWGVMSAKINTTDIMPVLETDDYYAEGIIHSPEDLQ